jgi:hypothetical protein
LVPRGNDTSVAGPPSGGWHPDLPSLLARHLTADEVAELSMVDRLNWNDAASAAASIHDDGTIAEDCTVFPTWLRELIDGLAYRADHISGPTFASLEKDPFDFFELASERNDFILSVDPHSPVSEGHTLTMMSLYESWHFVSERGGVAMLDIDLFPAGSRERPCIGGDILAFYAAVPTQDADEVASHISTLIGLTPDSDAYGASHALASAANNGLTGDVTVLAYEWLYQDPDPDEFAFPRHRGAS